MISAFFSSVPYNAIFLCSSPETICRLNIRGAHRLLLLLLLLWVGILFGRVDTWHPGNFGRCRLPVILSGQKANANLIGSRLRSSYARIPSARTTVHADSSVYARDEKRKRNPTEKLLIYSSDKFNAIRINVLERIIVFTSCTCAWGKPARNRNDLNFMNDFMDMFKVYGLKVDLL